MISKFYKSVTYALKGLAIGIREERNVRIDIAAMAYVFYFSTFYNFNKYQMALVVIICFVIPAFEMMNTSIERVVKNPYPDRYHIAGLAKDTAAGAVFVASIGAFIAGIMLFGDMEVFKEIFEYFSTSIFRCALLICSIILSYCFIMADKFFNFNKE